MRLAGGKIDVIDGPFAESKEVVGGWAIFEYKNKEEALAIHMKVLKSTRESAEEDYKYLLQDFQPFPKDGTVSKVSFDKTMELRAKEGTYQGKKVPPMSDYVDSSYMEEALKLAGGK